LVKGSIGQVWFYIEPRGTLF